MRDISIMPLKGRHALVSATIKIRKKKRIKQSSTHTVKHNFNLKKIHQSTIDSFQSINDSFQDK